MPLDQINLTETQQILLRAAEKVRKGWCQGLLADEHGNVCLVGAIVQATADTSSEQRQGSYQNARSRVAALITSGSAASWNDTPGRTAEEVATVLERAAFIEDE